MKTIKAYVDWNDEIKTHYYQEFEIIENLPEIESSRKYNNEVVAIEEVTLDCEQGTDEVYNYNYYKITIIDFEYYNEEKEDFSEKTIEDYTDYKYVAIKKD